MDILVNIKKIGFILILMTVASSCQQHSSKNGYVVNGIARNIPDSTVVSMYLEADSILDSTTVINEKFLFEGKVERPRRAILGIESSKGVRRFWLENNIIDITVEEGDMSNSKIIGSKTQQEAEILLERQDSIRKEMRRIGDMVTESNMDSLFAINEQMLDVSAEITKGFVEDYPDSFESLIALEGFAMRRLGGKETGKVYSKLNKELQNTKEGKAIAKFIELNKNPKVGEKFADFEQQNTEGQLIRLSDMSGKYTLVEFWASWCGPCRDFNPELVREYELYKDKGFVILNVSLDTNMEKWKQAIEKDGLIWENVSDLNGFNNEAAIIYGVEAIPENFLIDENGTIIARYLRGDGLKNKLKELFGKSSSL